MDFALSEDRRILADTLARYLSDRYPPEERARVAYSETGYGHDHWRALAELGMPAALFDAQAGGFGGSGFDIIIVFEALGRALSVEPFLGALMVGSVLAARQERKELPDIISGMSVAAFAHQEPSDIGSGSVETSAVGDDHGWILNGHKSVVAHAKSADLFLISAQAEAGLSLFLIPAATQGLAVRDYLNIEGGRSGDVTFSDVRVDHSAIVGAAGDGESLVAIATDAGLVALCAEALGVMEATKDATLEYLRVRQQFGVPIGSFQALQHRMVTLLLEIEQARSAVINAAQAYDKQSGAERARALSAAKYTIGRVGGLVAQEAIQLHGGIGMTWELPLSHYAKRLVMIDHQLGDEDFHLQRYMACAAPMRCMTFGHSQSQADLV